MPQKKKSTDSNLINKCVILTGGGSGGHLFPLQSVAQVLEKKGVPLIYLGRDQALERDVLGDSVEAFYGIPVGKFRRYWSLKAIRLNLIDIIRMIMGLVRSYLIITAIQKKYFSAKIVIFSTGGFVAIPPIISAYIKRIPIIIHEQTACAGLANQISAKMADTICTSFEESASLFNPAKTVYTGFPLREGLLKKITINKNHSEVVKKVFTSKKPVILFSGGSNGALVINEWVQSHLNKLTKKYTVCHQTGIGFLSQFSKLKISDYFPIGFTSQEEWAILLHRADIVVGRSGAGIVHECIHLNKKAIFIPLAIAQKNEQYHNAMAASQLIDTIIIDQKDLSSSSLDLVEKIDFLHKKSSKKPKGSKKKMFNPAQGAQRVAEIVLLKV